MVSVSDFKPENMKWEEITDRSKVAVEEALSGLLGEEPDRTHWSEIYRMPII